MDCIFHLLRVIKPDHRTEKTGTVPMGKGGEIGMRELKICPFCGGVAKMNTPGYEYYSPCWVKCTQCGAEGPVRASQLEAQEAWNRRTSERFDRWISVKDELPEEDVDVLVANDLGAEIAAYTTNPIKQWYGMSGQTVFVKYWMPLPELPEKEK